MTSHLLKLQEPPQAQREPSPNENKRQEVKKTMLMAVSCLLSYLTHNTMATIMVLGQNEYRTHMMRLKME